MIATKAFAAAALAAVAAASLPARAADRTPALQQVIAGAQKEGKLELQWGAGMIGDTANIKAMADGMNAMFGTSIAVRFTPGPSEPEMLNKVMIAAAANTPSPTDILISTNQYAGEASQNNLAVPVDWVALMPDRIQPQSVEAHQTVIRTFTTLPGAIIFNPTLVPYKPAKLTDLLKPEWKGKIATTPYAAGWELMTASDVWGQQRALEFAKQLSGQVAGLIRCNDLSRIAVGRIHRLRPQLRRPRRHHDEAKRRADRRGDPRGFPGRALLLRDLAEKFRRSQCSETLRAVPRKRERTRVRVARHQD